MVKLKNNKYLFLITLGFFFLGLFNIIFGALGIICMSIPLVLLFKNRKKTWCQGYCPRANMFTRFFQGRSLGKIVPKWFTKGNAKWFVFGYFGINLSIIVISTIMVLSGRIEPMEQLRFTLALPIPWEIPQFLNFGQLPSWLVHLGYRFYSMMITTTALGLLLGWVYTPRTWCTICPINTISDVSLKGIKEKTPNKAA